MARTRAVEELLVSANAKLDAVLPDVWEVDEDSEGLVRRAQYIFKKGQNKGLTLFARQFGERGSGEPYRSVVEVRRNNGDRQVLDDGRGAIAGWHPDGLGDPFNLDIADQLLNEALKESL